MTEQQQHDQGWWLSLVGWLSATSAGFFALVKFVRFAGKKIDRLLSLPEQIEDMGRKSLEETRRITEDLSDRVELLDGRVKLGQMLAGTYAFLELDASGLATFVSAQAVMLLGRTREDCLGNGFWSSIEWLGTDKVYMRDRWLNAKQSGERFECDVSITNEWNRTKTTMRLRVIPIHRTRDHKLLGWKALLTKPQDAASTEVPSAIY